MNEAIYGVFASSDDAERAISALKDHGAGGNEVSVLQKHSGAGLPGVERQADTGITPTSAGDVTAGAMKGGAAGLALGILAGAVALTIPGIGPILAAGPIASAIGAVLATTAAGAISGGTVGYFVDQGIPEEAAHSYHSALDEGNILVVVRSAHLAASEAALLLEKYGALRVTRHAVADFVRADDPGATDTVAAMNSSATAALNAAETRERVVSGTPVVAEPDDLSIITPAAPPVVTTTTTSTTTTVTEPVVPPVSGGGGARSF